VIFVTNDVKQDWWRMADGQLLGPRPELVEEIAAEGGSPFWAYTVSGFVDAASRLLGWEVAPNVTAEVAATASAAEAADDGRQAREEAGVGGEGDAADIATGTAEAPASDGSETGP
jgi:hypothetical protein